MEKKKKMMILRKCEAKRFTNQMAQHISLGEKSVKGDGLFSMTLS